MRRPANHSHACRKRTRQCLAPSEQSPQIRRGRRMRRPANHSHVRRKRARQCLAPSEQSPQIRRGDACVALQTTATHVERGRGNASPLANNHLKFVEGDACVAAHTTATYVERGRGNASPLANNHLKFVGATHASPCKPQPRMSKEGEAMPRPY